MQSLRAKDLRSQCLPWASIVLGISKLGCKLWHAIVGTAHDWPVNPKNCKQNINHQLTIYNMELAHRLIHSCQYGVHYQINNCWTIVKTKRHDTEHTQENNWESQKQNLCPYWKMKTIPCIATNIEHTPESIDMNNTESRVKPRASYYLKGRGWTIHTLSLFMYALNWGFQVHIK